MNVNANNKTVRIIGIIVGAVLAFLLAIGGFVWAQAGTNNQVQQNTIQLLDHNVILMELLEFKAELKTDFKWLKEDIVDIKEAIKELGK